MNKLYFTSDLTLYKCFFFLIKGQFCISFVVVAVCFFPVQRKCFDSSVKILIRVC